jgi:hypothetical protein
MLSLTRVMSISGMVHVDINSDYRNGLLTLLGSAPEFVIITVKAS